jgi:hypothetical protein
LEAAMRQEGEAGDPARRRRLGTADSGPRPTGRGGQHAVAGDRGGWALTGGP